MVQYYHRARVLALARAHPELYNDSNHSSSVSFQLFAKSENVIYALMVQVIFVYVVLRAETMLCYLYHAG